jgi:hypothetical protein
MSDPAGERRATTFGDAAQLDARLVWVRRQVDPAQGERLLAA